MEDRTERESKGLEIVEIAKQYIGIKEVGNNASFTNKEFEQDMFDVGWQRGWAYCILWAKLMWVKAYSDNEDKLERIKHVITPSVSLTINRLKKVMLTDNTGWSYGMDCIPGSIGLLQFGPGKGHAYIVESIEGTTITTIEANTNAGGSAEGDGIYRRKRKLTDSSLKGFIHPI